MVEYSLRANYGDHHDRAIVRGLAFVGGLLFGAAVIVVAWPAGPIVAAGFTYWFS